jgi:hypothetical protein
MSNWNAKYTARTINAHPQLSNTHSLQFPGRIMDPLRHKAEITPKNQKMFHSAMKKRDKYDYSLSEWEQADFKHRRVIDEYFDSWITTDPNHNNLQDIDLRRLGSNNIDFFLIYFYILRFRFIIIFSKQYSNFIKLIDCKISKNAVAMPLNACRFV